MKQLLIYIAKAANDFHAIFKRSWIQSTFDLRSRIMLQNGYLCEYWNLWTFVIHECLTDPNLIDTLIYWPGNFSKRLLTYWWKSSFLFTGWDAAVALWVIDLEWPVRCDRNELWVKKIPHNHLSLLIRHKTFFQKRC